MNNKLNKHDKVSLALHAAVKRELMSDPERVIKIAKSNLERWRIGYDEVPKWILDWSKVLDSGLSSVIKVLEGRDHVSTLLRSSSLFTGVISQQERAKIIKERDNPKNRQ